MPQCTPASRPRPPSLTAPRHWNRGRMLCLRDETLLDQVAIVRFLLSPSVLAFVVFSLGRFHGVASCFFFLAVRAVVKPLSLRDRHLFLSLLSASCYVFVGTICWSFVLCFFFVLHGETSLFLLRKSMKYIIHSSNRS